MTPPEPQSPSEMPQAPEMAEPEESLAPVPEIPEEQEEPTQSPQEKLTDIPTLPTEKGKDSGLKKIADDYVVPISESALAEWKKVGDEAKFKEYVTQVSMGLYPALAPQIQAGIPTRFLLDPYVQVAQEILGPVMTEPNWSDPKWAVALQGGQDAKTGRPSLMPLNQWRLHVMSDPSHGFAASPMGQQHADNLIKAIHSIMGGRS